MATEIYRDPDLEWLDHVPPVGLVVAPTLLKELGLLPLRQTPIDTGLVGRSSPSPPSPIPGPLWNRRLAGKRAMSPARQVVLPFPMNCLSPSRNTAPRFGRPGRSLN